MQHGPRSLNFVKKKNENRKIMHENMMLMDKIDKMRPSAVRREEINKH